MRAVHKHTDCKWILLYIERWLKAPAQLQDGTLVGRDKGTPQGGVISPLLANLFLHYAFDEWMKRTCPRIPFERYADDIIVHCVSEQQAKGLKAKIEERLFQCGLELHPRKTKVVYCKDDTRKGEYRNANFDFLGYTFRPRQAKRHNGMSLEEISRYCNPIPRGWIHYYGQYLTPNEIGLAGAMKKISLSRIADENNPKMSYKNYFRTN